MLTPIIINARFHVILRFISFNLVNFGEFLIFSKIFIFDILINNFSINDFFEKLLITRLNELLKLGASWLADHEWFLA